MLGGRNVRHQPADARQNIDGGKVRPFRQRPRQDDVTIEDSPHRIRHGFVHVIALDQDRVEPRDAAALSGPRALQKLGQDGEHRRRIAAGRRRLAAPYRSAEDLINIGAYADGTNPEIDRAKAMMGDIREFLVQGAEEHCEWDGTVARLAELAEKAGR